MSFFNTPTTLHKRKMQDLLDPQQVAKYLKRSGGTLKAMVLARLPQGSTSPNKKPPPTKIKILILSPTASVPYVKEQGGDYSLEQGQSYWFGAFGLNSDVDRGSIVVLGSSTRANLYNEVTHLSGKVSKLKCGSFAVMMDTSVVPGSFYDVPPSKSALETNGYLLIPLLDSSTDSIASLGCIRGYSQLAEHVYVGDNGRTGEKYIAAHFEEFGGYPITVMSSVNNVKVLASIKFFTNQLSCFGIVDVNAWKAFAPLLLENCTGVIGAYIHKESTDALEVNLLGASSGVYNYVVSLHCSFMAVDLVTTIRNVGFQVSRCYVQERFKGQMYVESNHASKNALWLQRTSSKVINLSEYTGTIQSFLEPNDVWSFFVLVDCENDKAVQTGQVEALKGAVSNQEREVALRLEPNTDWAYHYVFAIRN